jgi:hypothetical protein
MPSIKLNENVIESTAGAPPLTTQSNNTKPSLNLINSEHPNANESHNKSQHSRSRSPSSQIDGNLCCGQSQDSSIMT